MKLNFFVIIAVFLSLISCSDNINKNNLVDKNATERTSIMFEKLLSMCGKKTMFGHQDTGVYGHSGWMYIEGKSDIKDVCGLAPAVYGWELGHLELGEEVSLDSVSFNEIRKGIQYADSKGSINTISWHLRNPWNGNSAWDKSAGTIQQILTDSVVEKRSMSYLDRLADFLLSLKDERGEFIPVLLRPFHEHTGSWFWWGRDFCTPEEYKQLWRKMVSYLKDVKEVHNVLYIYSPDKVLSKQDYLDRYPGDEWVDIWGLDLYHRDGESKAKEYMDTASMILSFMSEECVQRKKPFVFSETGLSTLNMNNWFTEVLYPIISKTHPAYVLLWRNAYNMPDHFYAPYPGHSSTDDFNRFVQKQDIVMQGE